VACGVSGLDQQALEHIPLRMAAADALKVAPQQGGKVQRPRRTPAECGRDALRQRQADAGVKSRLGVRIAQRAAAHATEEGVQRCRAARGGEGDHMVQIGEDQAVVADPALREIRECVPACRADRHALRRHSPQERGRIGEVAIILAHDVAHPAVVKRERRLALMQMQVEQCAVPIDVPREIAESSHLPSHAVEPADTLPRASRTLQRMRHGMRAPQVGRLQRHGVAADALGAPDVAGLLQREGVAAADVAGVRHLVVPGRQGALDRQAQAGRIAQHESDAVRQLERSGIERVSEQMLFQMQRCLRHVAPLLPGGEAGDEGVLTRCAAPQAQPGARRAQASCGGLIEAAPRLQARHEARQRMAHDQSGINRQRRGEVAGGIGAMAEHGLDGPVQRGFGFGVLGGGRKAAGGEVRHRRLPGSPPYFAASGCRVTPG